MCHGFLWAVGITTQLCTHHLCDGEELWQFAMDPTHTCPDAGWKLELARSVLRNTWGASLHTVAVYFPLNKVSFWNTGHNYSSLCLQAGRSVCFAFHTFFWCALQNIICFTLKVMCFLGVMISEKLVWSHWYLHNSFTILLLRDRKGVSKTVFFRWPPACKDQAGTWSQLVLSRVDLV